MFRLLTILNALNTRNSCALVKKIDKVNVSESSYAFLKSPVEKNGKTSVWEQIKDDFSQLKASTVQRACNSFRAQWPFAISWMSLSKVSYSTTGACSSFLAG